ncbi:hypothetical protein Hanom_Chr04g00313491 [Helianthus anomalus]
MAEEETHLEEVPLPVLKWDQGLFEQITRGFRFPPEWDTQYPRHDQTVADAPPGYITLFEDFFLQGNFRLPASEFMAHILHYYGFHISHLIPPSMVQVRHFKFLYRSHGIEPTVERFRVFYQLIRNIGFYSFGNRGSAKKILLNPPKSFHDWKQKFFFIREEVVPIAMIFREPDAIEKEELSIPNGTDWYVKLTATPNRIFGENVLVAAQMKAHLYQAAFPTFGGSMGLRPLESVEPYWYERIKGHFLYPPVGAFTNPPTTTEGAHLPKPRPLVAVTYAGKDIFYLSSEESVGSSNGEISSWSNIFAGVLRDLGIDPEEKKKKTSKKKKVITIDAEVPSKKSGSRATAGVSNKDQRCWFKKLGKCGFKESRCWRYSFETATGVKVVQKTGGAPVIGKQSSLRSLYKFSPGPKQAPKKAKGVQFKDPKEPTPKKTKFIIKSSRPASDQPEKVVEKVTDLVAKKVVEKEKEKEKSEREGCGKA